MTITLHPSSLDNATLAQAYDEALAATGGTPAYTYAVTGGTLPPGIVLSSDGVFSGTPTTAGTYGFTVTATDSHSPTPNTGALAYTITAAAIVNIVVEDGSEVPGANSYVSLAQVMAIANNIGQGTGNALTAFNNLPSDAQSMLVVQAAAYLDRRFRYYGLTLDSDQAMQWPRTKNYDTNGRLIDPGVIPVQLQTAQALLCLFLAHDIDLQLLEMPNREGSIKTFNVSSAGISVGFGGIDDAEESEASAQAKDEQTVALFETRLKDVEVMLRSIGELLPLNYLGPDRQTLVNNFS